MRADGVSLPCLENGERGGRTTQMRHAAAACGNMLIVADARGGWLEPVRARARDAPCVPRERLQDAGALDWSWAAFDCAVICLRQIRRFLSSVSSQSVASDGESSKVARRA